MKTFIIAEAGVNHNGKLATAYKLCDAAKDAGADAVKFQMFNYEKIPNGEKILHLELGKAHFKLIHEYCGDWIEFMCTPFDVEAVHFLNPLVKRWKIGSGCRKSDIVNAVLKTDKEVIISCGMMDAKELFDLHFLWGDYNVSYIHCVSSYPCKPEHAGLKCITNDNYPLNFVGYSDHTIGITAPIAAVALGATIIEKHLTLDKTQEGPDHACSLEPHEFKEMVERIREVELMLGDGEKRILPCEEELRRQWYD